MKYIFRSFLTLWLLLLINITRAQEGPGVAQQLVSQPIPFQLTAGFLISVRGRIGEMDGLQFILDTGATNSVVARRIAKKLGVVRHADRVFSFQKYVEVERAEFPEVQFGPVKAENVSLLVADLIKTSEFAGRADAIIGLDLLCQSGDLRIDYDTETVAFLVPAISTNSVQGRRKPFCLTTQLIVQGQPVNLLIDTGMEGILLYENRLRRRIPDLRLEGKTRNAQMGWVQGKATTLPGIRWKDSETAMSVLLTGGPSEDVMPGIDGFLGTASLKARQIEFNFERNTVMLRW